MEESILHPIYIRRYLTALLCFTLLAACTGQDNQKAEPQTAEPQAIEIADVQARFFNSAALQDLDDIGEPSDPPIRIPRQFPNAGCSAEPAVVHSSAIVDGSSSSPHQDGAPLTTYDWTVLSAPAGANVNTGSLLLNGGLVAEISTFTPDVAGEYRLRLRIEDIFQRYDICNVTVIASDVALRLIPPSVTLVRGSTYNLPVEIDTLEHPLGSAQIAITFPTDVFYYAASSATGHPRFEHTIVDLQTSNSRLIDAATISISAGEDLAAALEEVTGVLQFLTIPLQIKNDAPGGMHTIEISQTFDIPVAGGATREFLSPLFSDFSGAPIGYSDESVQIDENLTLRAKAAVFVGP